MESTASGLTAAVGLACALDGQAGAGLHRARRCSARSARHVSTPNANFQPMNANYGILEPLSQRRVKGKRNRYETAAARAQSTH